MHRGVPVGLVLVLAGCGASEHFPAPAAAAVSTAPTPVPPASEEVLSEAPVLDLAELKARVAPSSSSLPSYHLTGAVWVPERPLLVNRDFDFALAMSLRGTGAGVAAQQRQQENQKLAARLASIPPLEAAEALAEYDGPAACGNFDPTRDAFAFYGLIYGGHAGSTARLHTVAERHRGRTLVGRGVHISQERALEDAGGWLGDDGATTAAAWKSGLPWALRALCQGETLSVSGAHAEPEKLRCAVGDREHHAMGVHATEGGLAWGTLPEVPKTVFVCRPDAS